MERSGITVRWTVLCAGALLSCWFAGASAQSTSPRPARDPFAEDLQLVIRSSRERFRNIEGVRVENRRREYYFEPKTYLPGASYCRILEGPVFCCEWEASGQAAVSLYEKLATRIQTVLGPDWSKNAKSAKLRKDTVFTAEGQSIVQASLHVNPPRVYVIVLPPGSSKDGYTGSIPAIESFLHP